MKLSDVTDSNGMPPQLREYLELQEARTDWLKTVVDGLVYSLGGRVLTDYPGTDAES